MARINPDPYAGGHLFALVNRATALLDSDDDVMATVRALEEDGVATDDIDLFVGEEGARRLDLSGRDHGTVIRWLRTLEAAMGEERETYHRLEEALRQGATLVCVKVHNRKGDEKARVLRLLRKLHGHEIHYWGPWSFEDHPSGPCAFCTLPAERILHENEHAVWILDIHPVSPGHSLIVPKRHAESFFETTPAEREAILSLLDRAREHVRRKQAPSGYNIRIHEGSAASEAGLHLRVHLIPHYAVVREAAGSGVRAVVAGRAESSRNE
jgi:diadenosine tetraphosphate (Ap4A) HIT family hydrolase